MTIRLSVKSPLNKIVNYSAGEGGTGAQQTLELQTKALLVVGTIQKVTQSTPLLNTDYPLGFAPGQDYAIGVINMVRAGAGAEPPFVQNSVEVPFMSTSFLLANSKSLIDTAAGAVANFIAAYRDSQGVGGYTANANSPSYYKV